MIHRGHYNFLSTSSCMSLDIVVCKPIKPDDQRVCFRVASTLEEPFGGWLDLSQETMARRKETYRKTYCGLRQGVLFPSIVQRLHCRDCHFGL